MAVDLHTGEAWIGPLGSMVRLPYVSSMEIDPSRASSEFRSASGARRMQFAPRGARQWNVALPGYYSDEYGQLVEFLDRTPGVHCWVDPVARSVNMLEPTAASLLTVKATSSFTDTYWVDDTPISWNVDGGPQVRGVTGAYRAVRAATFQRGGTLDFYDRDGITMSKIPVLPGVPITASTYAIALDHDATYAYGTVVTVTLYAYDAGGTYISSASKAATMTIMTTGVVQRVSLTIPEVPSGVAYYTFRLGGGRADRGMVLFRPSVTLTSAPREWGPGLGANSVVATVGPVVPRHAWLSGPKSRFDLSMNVVEVS